MADEHKIKRVVVVIAMLAEATPLIKSLGCDPDTPDIFLVPSGKLGRVYKGNVGDLEVMVVCNGTCQTHGCDAVGKVPAALVTLSALRDLSPDILINAGTCGGFKSRGCDIGDVFIISDFKIHDARIPLPILEDYGIGSWPAYKATILIDHLKAKRGSLTTGDSLDCPDQDLGIINIHASHVKDMEGGAIAFTAQLYGVPLVAIKSVTDIVDGDRATQEEFLENLHTAAAALNDNLSKTLLFLNGKSTEDLKD